MDAWTEERDRKVAKTIREAVTEAHEVYEDDPLPDTSTPDGVLEVLGRSLEYFIEIFEADVQHRQWGDLATTAAWLDRLQFARDYVADVGLPNVWHRSAGGAESDYQVVRAVIEDLEDAIVTDEDGTAYSADLSTRDGALEILNQSLETTQGFLHKETVSVDYYTERVANLRTAIAWVVANGMPPVGATK